MSYAAEKERKLEEEWKAFNNKIKGITTTDKKGTTISDQRAPDNKQQHPQKVEHQAIKNDSNSKSAEKRDDGHNHHHHSRVSSSRHDDQTLKRKEKEARDDSPHDQKKYRDRRDEKEDRPRDVSRSHATNHNNNSSHHSSSNKDTEKSSSRHSDKKEKRHDKEKRREKKSTRSSRKSRSSSSDSSSERKKSKHKSSKHSKSSRRHRSRSGESSRHKEKKIESTTKEKSDKDRERNDFKATKDSKGASEKNETVKVVDQSLNLKSTTKIIPTDPNEFIKYQAEELRKKAEEMTGVKVPSFYSATAINPLVYAEQEKKRKLLWSKPKENEITSTKIVGQAILESQDEKTAEKFRKLMGIKSDEVSTGGNQEHKDGTKSPKGVDQINKMQKQAFEALDKEYEYARVTTHLNRGKGLGFASHAASVLLNQNPRTLPQ